MTDEDSGRFSAELDQDQSIAEGFRALREEKAPAPSRERAIAALGLDLPEEGPIPGVVGRSAGPRSPEPSPEGRRGAASAGVFLRWVLIGLALGLLFFVLGR
jgi:hypothetical protein